MKEKYLDIHYLLEGNSRFLSFALFLGLVSSGIDILGMLLLPAFLLVTLYPVSELASFPRLGVANWAFNFPLSALLSLMIMVFVARGGIVILAGYVNSRLAQRVSKILGQRLARAYLYCELEQLVERPFSYITTVVNSYSQIFTNQVVLPSLRLMSSLVIAAVIVSFLSYVEPFVLVFVLPMLFFLGFTFVFSVRRVALRFTDRLAASQKAYQRELAYAFRGARETRVLQVQPQFLVRMRQVLNQRATATAGLAAISASPRAIGELAAVCLALGYMVYTNQASVHSSVIVAHMGIYAFAGMRLINCFSQITVNLSMIRAGVRVVGTLADELRQLSPNSPPNAQKSGATVEEKEEVRLPFRSLEVRSLSFNYKGHQELVLRDLDFQLNRNESVGIMGSSGSGKSTLVDVLLGLLRPVSGGFIVNGSSVELGNSEWWQRIGFVPQTPFVANDTLAKNIAFGCDESSIDYEILEHVIRMAQLESVVEKLKEGIHTQIGDLGERLSGGQRQRLAIARALYFQREILIFDEATSSLDEQTEADIVAAIDSLRHNITTIVVAHRKSTLKNCDRVLELKDGKLREITIAEA